MESGNREWAETVAHVQRLRKQKFKRNEGGEVCWRDAGDFFEADALVAQFQMRQLIFCRRFLAQVGDGVCVSRLLCKQQQQDQQAGQDAIQFHGLGRNRRAV